MESPWQSRLLKRSRNLSFKNRLPRLNAGGVQARNDKNEGVAIAPRNDSERIVIARLPERKAWKFHL
jgi:hypothetical protein